LERLQQENDEYLKALSARLEASLKAQLEAETIKQRDLLLKKISHDLVAKAATRSSVTVAPSTYANEDLRKLIPTNLALIPLTATDSEKDL
jgi:hypothetical protein